MPCSLSNSKVYRPTEFHHDLKILYEKTGGEKKHAVFLLNDTQVVYESFLEDISDYCAKEAREKGVMETAEEMYKLYLERARSHMHIVLCLSPVGEAFGWCCKMFVTAIVSMFVTAIVVVCVMLNVSPLWLVFEIDSVVEGLHEHVVLGNGWLFQNPGPVSIVRVDSQDFRNNFLSMPFQCKSAVEQLLPELFGT